MTLTGERLEPRDVPAVSAALSLGTLTVNGTGGDRIDVYAENGRVVVADRGVERLRVPADAVRTLDVGLGGGDNVLRVADEVVAVTTIDAAGGRNVIRTGGGPATVVGGPNPDVVTVGRGGASVDPGGGNDFVYRAEPNDAVAAAPDRVVRDAVAPPGGDLPGQFQQTITAGEVDALLRRAAVASATTDGIIAVVDRNGRILGVRVEEGVSPALVASDALLVFAVDGAVAKARTGALFGNNQAPLTSRTVQFISQSTVTQREVEANPNVQDANSTVAGPGFVAPVGVSGHFPPNVPQTPQVDLFGIEHTNRDSLTDAGPDGVRGTADDETLRGRFDTDPANVPAGQHLFAPESYGVVSGRLPGARGRGIATLPGGIPVYKNGQVVGGIGVFYPGRTGYATEENSALGTTFDPTKPDRAAEAEWVAVAATSGLVPDAAIDAVPLPAGFRFPTVTEFGSVRLPRIDLVGITLDVVGPGGEQGFDAVKRVGAAVGRGAVPAVGANQPLSGVVGDALTLDGLRVPDGWLVLPHDGVGVTRAEVEAIILAGIREADDTRAAIRGPAGVRTKMVFAVADRDGNVVGLYRMPDATVFSIDVAVAKARNVNYYADPAKLQPQDQAPGVPAGTAFTNRTFRYLANPRFPIGVDGTPPAPFSQLLDGGADPTTGIQVGPRLPASAYRSVFGYDAFHPGTNFRDPTNRRNRNGVVFFPGSAPLYRAGSLIGGFGVSGDGVDQDDVVTNGGQRDFGVPLMVRRADQVTVAGVRLPYQKFDRNPDG